MQEYNNSFVNLICIINNTEEMFKLNINNIYINKTLGVSDYGTDAGTDDDVGKQIKNLKNINYIFNINEVFVIRTFDIKKIIIYIIMEDKMYIYNTKKTIYNVIVFLENYIVLFFENNFIEIVNLKTFKSTVLIKNTIDICDFYKMVLYIIENKDSFFKNTILKKSIKPLLLPKSAVKNKTNNHMDIFLQEKKDVFICERIWSVFTLQENNSYCISYIECNTRFFKYIININNKQITFENIYKLIDFMKINFYIPIKTMTFLV